MRFIPSGRITHSKSALVLVADVSLDGNFFPKGEIDEGVLGILAIGLAFLRAVDAAQADALRMVTVQYFDDVAVDNGDDGAGGVSCSEII